MTVSPSHRCRLRISSKTSIIFDELEIRILKQIILILRSFVEAVDTLQHTPTINRCVISLLTSAEFRKKQVHSKKNIIFL
jgi:hypothetical protein